MKNSTFTQTGTPPLYLTSIGKYKYEMQIKRSGGHMHFHYMHTMSGKGILILDNQEYLLGQNTGFFMYPKIPHEYYAIEQPWETHWMTFEGEAADLLCQTLGLKRFEVFYIPEIHSLNAILNQIYLAYEPHCALARAISREPQTSALIYQFLTELSQSKQEKKPAADVLQHRQLQSVISYIESNYQADPSLKELAGVIGVSPQYLCRIFKNMLNMRPFEYITKLRLRHAKEMLLEAEYYPHLVRDIAEAIGYNDTSYFCFIFKKYESLTPLQFRSFYLKKRQMEANH